MTYQNILFDVDGTLLDTLSAAVMAAKDTLLALTGKQYSTDELRFAFGLPISQSAKMLGISNVREFEECYAQNYKNTAQEHIRVFPGVYELLKALRERNLLLGVITSKARWEYEHLFDKFRLKEYFSCTICAEDTKKHKPDAAPLLAFFAQTGAKKECSLYIGDGTHDLACAQNAGVAFANAAWGSAPLPGAAHVLHSPSELISLL